MSLFKILSKIPSPSVIVKIAFKNEGRIPIFRTITTRIAFYKGFIKNGKPNFLASIDIH